MTKQSSTRERKPLKIVDELSILSSSEEVSRHLKLRFDKPCVSAYFSKKAWPKVGERGKMFYALTSELRRVDTNEDTAKEKLLDYFHSCPDGILNVPGQDGRPFSEKELIGIIKSVYKQKTIKSYGCNSGVWDLTCPGPDVCYFKKQLSNGKPQSGEASIIAFLSGWLGSKGPDGKPRLFHSDILVYLAICLFEKKRGYKPGAVLYISWSALSKLSGIARPKIGNSLMNLFWAGLIAYQKGVAQQRGTASEIRRVTPVPKPKIVTSGD